MRCFSFIYIFLQALSLASAGFDPNSSTNLAVYWGQNSAGSTGGAYQTRLSTYCANSDVNIILISFLIAMNGVNGQPWINFANQESQCDHSTNPIRCPEIEADIWDCQSRGKTILLSLGGAASSELGYANTADAKAGAEKIWAMFGPDQHRGDIVRPFGSAIVDGFDFDFEHSVSNIVAFGNALHYEMQSCEESKSKKFYLSAAPVCAVPNPLEAIQDMIVQIPLDMVFVQFYNSNICDTRAGFNFETWNAWATRKNTVFFVGLPASEAAAPSGGYVLPEQLQDALGKAKGFDRMKGAMLWDASQAWANDNYHCKVKDVLKKVSSYSWNRWTPRYEAEW